MTYIMNTAVMTTPGHYECMEITREDFLNRVREAYRTGTGTSRIGYQQNAVLIHMWTGGEINLPVNRKETRFRDGDEMLSMCLKYRTDGYKGGSVDPYDFRFFYTKYTEI